MELLSQLATAFLGIEDEDRNASLTIASVAVLEGPVPERVVRRRTWGAGR